MPNETKSVIHCAIYTRKSSEEGLEQSFNSLEAQREACEAYIASQKHERWRGIATHYDDGGYSGGSMERPALIGELHGSNETPAAFRDLVCDAIVHGKQVTVALERPTSEQSALDNILTAKNLSTAKESLLQFPRWKEGMDGLASEAMLRLLVSLRELRRLHPDLKVVGFDAPYTGTAPGARDGALGHALLSLRPTKPNDLVLILTGNLHAMQAPERGYDLAAMYLPPTEILSLEVTDRGGVTWSESTTDGCGPLKGGVGDKNAKKPYGIFLDPSLAPFGKVNGVFSLGVPLTPSAPAFGEPSPIPACRAKFLAEHQTVPKTQ